MKITFTALELILHLTEGSTTPNTLQHIQKIARSTIDALKEQEELQPFKDMTDKSYLRGVKDAQQSLPQRTWVGLMRGVRVEGDTVVISVKGGNDAARELCAHLIDEMN